MRPPPLFLPGSRTPRLPASPGIVFDVSPFHGARAWWVHGVLTIPDDRGGSGAEWARSLFAFALTEEGCQPQLGGVTDGRAPAGASFIDSGLGLLHLPFHFDLIATLPYPLQPEPTWVHVSAQEFCAAPRRLDTAPSGALEPPTSPVDALIAAYALAREGDRWGAVEHFRGALDERLRNDFDGAHLLAAARVASSLLGELGTSDEPAAEWLAAAAAWWVADDLRRRAGRLARLAVALVGCDDEARAGLLAERDAHAEHLARVRDDVGLAPLRARPEYAAIFRPSAG